MRVYTVLASASIRKNFMYSWAHMANNAGSALFGFIYMALWQAASHGHRVGAFSAKHLVGYIAVGQLVLWLTTFLPNDLGVSQHIRTGQIALEFARPIGYLQRVVAAGVGEVIYNLLFRSLPLAIAFLALGDLPLGTLHSPVRVLSLVAALMISSYNGLIIQYLIGITAFWTMETRWARRLFFVFTMFCGGQLLPLALMPALLRQLFTWMPFQSLISFPVMVWLHMDDRPMWGSAIAWLCLLTFICRQLTQSAARRLEVQGG